jgi:protein deglycase
MSKKALVPIANGSEEIEAVCIIDTLRRAEVEVTVASISGKLLITASRGTMIQADAHIADCAGEAYDLIVLPGGMPGAEHLRDCTLVMDMLKMQRNAGKLYGAICASPAVALLPHGLLEGRTATCFPTFRERLEHAENVTASDDRVVVDGNLVTSQGPGTAIEFALKLVELLLGDAEEAEAIGKRMLIKRP